METFPEQHDQIRCDKFQYADGFDENVGSRFKREGRYEKTRLSKFATTARVCVVWGSSSCRASKNAPTSREKGTRTRNRSADRTDELPWQPEGHLNELEKSAQRNAMGDAMLSNSFLVTRRRFSFHAESCVIGGG